MFELGCVSLNVVASPLHEEASLGDLDVLPQWIIVDIFSHLPQPFSVSRVCRKMTAIAFTAVDRQLIMRGINAKQLGEEWKIDLHPVCLAQLDHFHIDLLTLMQSGKKIALENLSLLLDNRLDLLSNPAELSSFLSLRLLENSNVIAKVFYGDEHSRTKGFVERCLSYVMNVITLSKGQEQSLTDASVPRTKAVRLLVDSLHNKSPICSEVVFTEKPAFTSDEYVSSLPMSILHLLPSEVFHQVQRSSRYNVIIHRVDKIPSEIGLFGSIDFLDISHVAAMHLPKEIGALAVKHVSLHACPNLEDLPSSLVDIQGLEQVVIRECFGLQADDPVLLKLREKNVKVLWM